MHILHTVLYTFLKGLKKEFVLKFESFWAADHFLYSHDLNVLFSADILGRNSVPVPLRGQRANGENLSLPNRLVDI